MIIVGAGGHAKEVLGICSESGQDQDIFFFDDVSVDAPKTMFGRFEILKSVGAAKTALAKDPRFILGIGKPVLRQAMEEKFSALGGILTSAISPSARIGPFAVTLGAGLNIMPGAVITQDIIIGKGVIVHVNASVHHDCRIGDYCELSPGCHILGKAIIGDFSSIGAGAVILPGITIGRKVIVGAGAVVTHDIGDGLTVKGIPAS